MGKKDNITKEYMQDSRRFADLCNAVLFHGRQVIVGGDLEEKDTTEILNFFYSAREGKRAESVSIQKYRDVLKNAVIKENGEMCLAVIGIENQTEINYVMPVRGMLYDALNYASQIADFKKTNHTEKKLKSSAEFLSGITSECRLKPVITIVLYWGAEKWDAPRSLHEMLDLSGSIAAFIPDYRLNLVVPCEISDNHMFQTELGTALAAVQASGDKNKLYALVHSNPAYQKLDTDTMKLLSVLLSFKFSQESEKHSYRE